MIWLKSIWNVSFQFKFKIADDVYYLYLEYYYQTGQFDEFKNMIREMQGKQVVTF